jgi:glycosyltransferase involved in cell wall biosynthesis
MSGPLAEWARRVSGAQLGRLQSYEPRPLVLPPHYGERAESDETVRFALVTPVLDQAAFIASTLKSVEGQHYGNLDYLVKDGGSSDGTLQIAQRVMGAAGQVISQADTGLADALNQGFARVRGDVMAWLNGDDLLLPGALHYVARFMARHPDVDAVYGHRILIDANGDEVGRWVLPAHDDRVLSYADFIPQETLFWRRELWERVGSRVDDSFAFAVDWDLLLRFRDVGARIVRLPRFLGAFRVHPAQKSAREMDDVGRAEIARIHQRTLGHPPSPAERLRGVAAYAARHVVLNQLDRWFNWY